MINEIKVFNVNFGDCFICSDENANKMLIDFGNSNNNFEPKVIDAVNNELTNSQSKYLMVTHFHSDHINGLAHLDKNIKFKSIYLPNFFSQEIIRLQFMILAFLSTRSAGYKIAYNLLHLLPNILDYINKDTRIEFVARKDKIYNNLDKLRILWPDFNFFERQAKALNDYFAATEEINIGSVEIIDHYANEYFEKLRLIISRDINIREGVSNLDRILKDFDTALHERKQLFIKDRYITNDLKSTITSYQNDICLCFDNAESKDNHVLFLSDISTTYFNIINSKPTDKDLRLLKYYKAIKAAHHGTKKYFVSNLPESDAVIISNGNTGNISWQISALYGYHYDTRNLICTNYYGACEYSLCGDRCLPCLQNANTVCGENTKGSNVIVSILHLN